MYKHKLNKDFRCPLEYGIDIFGGKWKSRIICVLGNNGVLRYNEIRKEMTDITDTVLTSTLKELIESKMVLRIQYNNIPPHVEYSLTEKGYSVIPILQSICEWSNNYLSDANEEDISDKELSYCLKCKHALKKKN